MKRKTFLTAKNLATNVANYDTAVCCESQTQLPSTKWQDTIGCPHILYSFRRTVAPASFKLIINTIGYTIRSRHAVNA